MKKISRTAFFLVMTLSRRTIIEGRMTNAISVRPLTTAMKYAQDVCFEYSSAWGCRSDDEISLRD